jgi:hypothetical protein
MAKAHKGHPKSNTHSGKGNGTKRGVKPNAKKSPKPGSGHNHPAKGFDPETKTWDQK